MSPPARDVRRRVALVGLVLLSTLGCAAAEPRVDANDAPTVAAPAGDVVLHPGGWPELAALIRAANEEGRPVVVNLFASWCEPCEEELPLLRRASEDHPEVAFVGVDHRDLADAGERLLAAHPLGFPTLWDFEGDVAEAIGARGMPTTAFFDASGRLHHLHTGIVDRDLLARRIAEIVPEG